MFPLKIMHVFQMFRDGAVVLLSYLRYVYVYYSNSSYGRRPGINSRSSITHIQGKHKQISVLVHKASPDERVESGE